MKALLGHGLAKARKPSLVDGGGGSGGSSMAVLTDMLKAEKSAAIRLESVQKQVRGAVDDTLSDVSSIIGTVEASVLNSIQTRFEGLSRRAVDATASVVAAEAEAARDRMKSQSTLFEARLETMRKASQMQLKNQQAEMQAKHDRAFQEQRQTLLQGGDGAPPHGAHHAGRSRGHR